MTQPPRFTAGDETVLRPIEMTLHENGWAPEQLEATNGIGDWQIAWASWPS